MRPFSFLDKNFFIFSELKYLAIYLGKTLKAEKGIIVFVYPERLNFKFRTDSPYL